MSEYYVLKKAIDKDALDELNIRHWEDWARIFGAAEAMNHVPDTDQIEDWIAGIKSDTEIVNPVTPREELRSLYFDIDGLSDFHSGISQALKIIAKEHPDVAGWLKDGEQDA
ncbi:MAG: hypothetical protein ACE3JK_01790 [Sporolactobacillus sp.]